MTTPNLLAEPIAETTVTGTAIANAQGLAATNTTNARVIHNPVSPKSAPITPTRTARIITPGTRGRAILSAMRAHSPLSACAYSTNSTIVVKELSRSEEQQSEHHLPI